MVRYKGEPSSLEHSDSTDDDADDGDSEAEEVAADADSAVRAAVATAAVTAVPVAVAARAAGGSRKARGEREADGRGLRGLRGGGSGRRRGETTQTMSAIKSINERRGHLRRAGSARVRVGVEEDTVDDVDDTVREEDVRLDDGGGSVADGDVAASRVQVEADRFTGGGGVVL